MNIKRGLFITLEGPEACGKTTIAKYVYQLLVNHFNNPNLVVLTREPGGTVVGEKIRDILTNYDVDSRTEALLFAAARSEHVWSKILKEKANNHIIICDRFIHSSLVYQGIAKNLGYKKVYKINQFGIGNLKPDLVFYLSVAPNVIINRIKNDKKRDPNDKLETVYAKEEYIRKILAGYASILQFDYNSVFKLDGSLPVKELATFIFNKILLKLK